MCSTPEARNPRTTKTVRKITGGVALILICLFSNAFAQDEKTPNVELDIQKWISESFLKINQTNLRMISDYTYKMRRSSSERNGKTNIKLSESYFPARLKNKGRTQSIVILLEENGVALSEKKIEKQRREAAEKLEKMGNASAQNTTPLEEKREKGVSLDFSTNQVSVGLGSFLRVCRFHTPHRETVDGRATIVLSFNQCDPAKLPENKSYLANLQGKAWFDVSDKVPVRVEAWANTSPVAPPKVPVLFIQQRVAESVWLPSLIRVEGIGNEAVLSNLKINWQIEFFDYKLSQTEIENVIIGAN